MAPPVNTQQKKMKKSAEAFSLESASCSGCGATIVFEENEALSKCAFCGRSLVRKEYLYDAGLPESVIPFGITKAEAQQRLEEWCDRNRRKKEAKRLRSMIPELKGFYLPYETVRGPVRCRVSCKRTAKVYGFDGFVNDEFVNGSKQLDNLLLNAMEPFDLDGLEAFDFAYLAGQRAGTACTKTRGDVSGGGAKPFRQKGTGRARSGSSRSPVWVGGGTIFGPRPRSFAKKVNKKVLQLALKRALSGRIVEGDVVVVDAVALPDHKTKNVVAILKNLNLADSTVMMSLPSLEDQAAVVCATGNLSNLVLRKAENVNVYELLRFGKLLFTKDALDAFIQRLA